MKKWKKTLLIIIAVIIGSYAAFMTAYFITSEPRFCESCHDVDPYVDSWREYPHNSVKCLYCHEKRGYLGKIHSKLRGLNYVYQQFTGQYTIIVKALIFEENCIACHLGDYYNYPNAVRMDMQHYEYIKQNKSCLQCHRETGHKINMFTSEKFKKK